MYSVLCIDDADEQLQALTLQLIDTYHVITCNKPLHAIPIITKYQPDAVILDLQMPKRNGFELLSEIGKIANPPPVLMLSGHADPIYVVRALGLGAKDFLSKPYTASMLRHRLKKIILSSISQDNIDFTLIGESAALQTLKTEIATFSHSELPILILGESGTGKDLVAREIHRQSSRSQGPFVVRNIGAIPSTLIESELFGCEEGAFTDARPHKGCFELANGGSLFLDEIGEASPALQVALLRIIEDGYVRRLGGQALREISFRLITATNKNLDELIELKCFRSDLKYRLEGITIYIPPLRDRKEDIPALAKHFLKPYGTEIADNALAKLSSYFWPGNVRQLKMTIERASMLAGTGPIQAEHIRF
ncbi:sigma-54 dependent transcriptional regulator [Gracilinema caldarium]|uniref:sigma-54-dependent transcriptional regulator n=1 Tax=Gracilinema caldarium TaxID=215591 RepID=UPI0026E9B045|nr:sigma-54 dependent transcriptional regulator [Gracilinema caldarium]